MCIKIIVTAFITLAALWLAGLSWFVYLVPKETLYPIQSYDAIIALTGGKLRIPYATELLKQNKAERLFISGVGNGFRFEDIEGELPESLRQRIEYGEEARSTIGNAEETLKWLEGKGYKRLLVVTANYHTPRTRLLFRHYLKGYKLTFAAVDPPLFHLERWLTHPNSRRLMISEYHKWLATWLHVTVGYVKH